MIDIIAKCGKIISERNILKGDDTLRQWLKDIREKKNLSQSEVAKKAGITQGYYCDIENGLKGVPTLSVPTAKKIASALGFKWTKFYESKE